MNGPGSDRVGEPIVPDDAAKEGGDEAAMDSDDDFAELLCDWASDSEVKHCMSPGSAYRYTSGPLARIFSSSDFLFIGFSLHRIFSSSDFLFIGFSLHLLKRGGRGRFSFKAPMSQYPLHSQRINTTSKRKLGGQ